MNDPRPSDSVPSRLGQAWKRWLDRWPRRIVPTRTGLFFFGFMALAVTFGFTTGNNLLFLLFAAMLALMVVSGLMSEMSIGRIEVERRLPDMIFARSPFPVEYRFGNRATLFGASAFGVLDRRLVFDDEGPFVPYLPPGGERTVRANGRLPFRGRVRLPAFDLLTRFPFLLFTKLRRLPGGEETVVYPAVRRIELPLETLLAAGEGGLRETTGGGGSVAFLHEYRPGMPLGRVDWKKSARMDDLYVKEFERPASRQVAVVFDPRGRNDHEPGLEMAASLLVHLHQHGVPFCLSAGGEPPTACSCTPAALHEALTRLALYAEPAVPRPPVGDCRVIEVDAAGRLTLR